MDVVAPGQASFDGLWWLCLAIVFGIFIGLVWFIYWLGKLPSQIAHARGHPQASAISTAGWLGLLFPPLWALALVWACANPSGKPPERPADLKGLGAALDGLAPRVARIERELGKGAAS